MQGSHQFESEILLAFDLIMSYPPLLSGGHDHEHHLQFIFILNSHEALISDQCLMTCNDV